MIYLAEDKKHIGLEIHKEEKFLTDYLKSQEIINCNIQKVLKKVVADETISSVENAKNFSKNLSGILSLLKKSNLNIDLIQELIKKINSIIVDAPDYEKKIKTFNFLYSNHLDKIVKNTIKLERFLSNFNDYLDKSSNEQQSENTNGENILLISEAEQKVVLPYTMENVNKMLIDDPNKYKTIKDVIDNVYTKPIGYYRYSSIMRFKEAFNLVRKREHGSFIKALDLGLELFSNYSLHPAVITACKNLNELDIYLACLEYNELDDFHFFKTIFKMKPIVSHNTTKNLI